MRRLIALLLLAAAPALAAGDPKKKVLVLGVDGLDPTLLQGFMDDGLLPNFSKLAASGDFKPLQTVMPPLSPTAWSMMRCGRWWRIDTAPCGWERCAASVATATAPCRLLP